MRPRLGRKSGVLLVHPGTQHSFNLARQLSANGLLSGFWTGFAIHRGGVLFRVLQSDTLPFSRDAIANRVIDGIPGPLLHTWPWIEFSALARIRSGQDPQAVMHERNRRFQEAIPDAAFERARSVIGFDTSSWILATRAASAGLPLLLDRSAPPPAHARSLFNVLAQKYPDWSDDFRPRIPTVAEAERREHEDAACIVVASSFTRRCLVESGVAAGKICVIPYGVDANAFAPGEDRPRTGGIRFLYAGPVNARKGVPLLLDAWRALDAKDCVLTLVGSVAKYRQALIAGITGVDPRGRVPHAGMPGVYSSHDVLVFPSYHDGFGLVILEAMAAAIPVIATQATAAPDLIADGEDGYVIPVGDATALAERMSWFVRDRDGARRMGRAAREKARQYSWEKYGTAWARLLAEKGFA